MNSAKAFFTGVVDKEGKNREPVATLVKKSMQGVKESSKQMTTL